MLGNLNGLPEMRGRLSGYKHSDRRKRSIAPLILSGLFLFTNFLVISENAEVSAETPLKDSNLKLYYSFDNNDFSSNGLNVKDESGNSIHGSLNGGSYYTGNTVHGRTVRYDGDGDYIYIASVSSLNIGGDLTIEAWIYLDYNPQINTIAGNEGKYWFYIGSDYRLGFESGWGDWKPDVISDGTVSTFKWTYVAVTRSGDGADSGEVKFYIDGKLQGYYNGNDRTYGPDATDDETYIGCWDANGQGSHHYFDGMIDEVKIWNNVLTPSNGLGRCVLSLGFEEGAGTTVFDRSGIHAPDISAGVYGGASFVDYKVYDGHSLQFDGSNDYVMIDKTVSDLTLQYDLTIEAWIKWDGSENVDTIIANEGDYWLYIRSDDRLGFESGHGPSWSPDAISSSTVPTGKWVKIAVQRIGDGDDPGDIVFYFNGVKDSYYVSENKNNDYTYSASGTQSETYIGCWGDSSGKSGFFDGKIDSIQMFNCIKPVGCAMVQYEFESKGSSTAVDGSPLAYDGSISGGAQIVPSNGISYGGVVSLDGIEDYVSIAQKSKLDTVDSITLEARVCMESKGNDIQTIIANEGNYWLYLFKSNEKYYVGFEAGNDPWDKDVLGTIPIVAYSWTNIMVTRMGNGGSDNSVSIYVDGVLDVSGKIGKLADTDSKTYIGCWGGNQHYFKGILDNIVVSNYVKPALEDTDSDAMSDIYEIVRSEAGLSNQYNPLEYNGRYGILCAPVRPAPFKDGNGDGNDDGDADDEVQYKYDITAMRMNMIANGWRDCDIIFLTTTNEHSHNYGDGKGARTTTKASGNNGFWIDGEAYRQNLQNALDVMDNGGSFHLNDDENDEVDCAFAQSTTRDTVFIELRDHGAGWWNGNNQPDAGGRPDDAANTDGYPTNSRVGDEDHDDESPDHDEGYCTYAYNDLSFKCQNFYYDDELDADLDQITNRYMILIFDICFSGGFVKDCSKDVNNRAILTSQRENSPSDRYACLFYARFWGDVRGAYSDSGSAKTEAHNENANADGITALNNREVSTRGDKNAIISVQEAAYSADVICNDKRGNAQTPQSNYGTTVQNAAQQLYL